MARLTVVIVLLLSVLIVFVSPAVDLEPTALRAMQAANLLFAALVLAASVMAALISLAARHIGSVRYLPSFWTGTDLVDLNCVRLC